MPRFKPGNLNLVLIALSCAALMTASVVLAGCGDNTPEGAVGKLMNAWQDMDWQAYKAAVIPAESDLPKDLEELAKQAFQQVRVKFDGIKMKTVYDEKDKNKAAVILDGGKMTINAKILGENKKETRDILKMPKEERTYETQKVDGVWYVNIKLG